MFKQQTVLILGAGASCHYGYPTGEQLILKVCKLADSWEKEIKSINGSGHSLNKQDDLFPLLNLPKTPLHDSHAACAKQKDLLEKLEALISKLKSLDPINIDTFLRDNPQLREIGKILIASVLLGCEKDSIEVPHNDHKEKAKGDKDSGERDNWYRFLVHALAGAGSKKELLEIAAHSKLIIITFNYDVSLEYHLYRALSTIEAIGEKKAKQFMKKLKIIHVYGELRKINWNADEPLKGYGASNTVQLAMHCAKGIETIDRDKQQKLAAKKDIAIAKSAVANASRLVILGYGFDDANNEIIGLNGIISQFHSKGMVLYTNYDDSARIEKKIRVVSERRDKSTKNVYRALAEDFDLT